MADATTQYLTHITTDGERWDHLADRYYGDPYDYVRIVEANPQIAILEIFPAGVTVFIPILDAADTLAADLPPWKQGAST